jgi:hypothetical protein
VQPLCQNVPIGNYLSLHFTKQVAGFFAWDIRYPIFAMVGLLFFPHCDQRKEAKERRLIGTDILCCWD